jgi:hypothetical protein
MGLCSAGSPIQSWVFSVTRHRSSCSLFGALSRTSVRTRRVRSRLCSSSIVSYGSLLCTLALVMSLLCYVGLAPRPVSALRDP